MDFSRAVSLTSLLQTDPLEHHCGLYRMKSGANQSVVLESERRLKVSNILNMFSKQTVSIVHHVYKSLFNPSLQ